MAKEDFTKKEIIQKFKSRIKTQTRIYRFGKDQILLPYYLEYGGENIDDIVNKIKLFYDEQGNYTIIENISGLNFKGQGVCIVTEDGEHLPLYESKSAK
jgi:hypothetical protein